MRHLVPLLALFACVRPLEMPEPQPGAYASRPSVDARILETLQRDRVPGAAVCTFDSTGPTWCTAYGWAHILEGRPALVDTPFLVASVSKAVTGVVILQGVEEGALGLDDAVNEHLTFEATHPTSATSVTLRQLMTHTSGILDDWDVLEPLYVDGDSPMALGAFLSDYLDGPLTTEWVWSDWAPGEGYEYSNVGTALAAHVLEGATGEGFNARSRERVFEPLAMDRSGWFFADHDPSELAMPYTVSGSVYTPVGHYGVPDYPDGQLRTSAEDLAKFGAMILRGGTTPDGEVVLGPEMIDAMKQVYVEDEDQGLFWYYFDLDGERVFGHNGGETGVSAELLLRGDRGVVVLLNGEGRSQTLSKLQLAALDGA